MTILVKGFCQGKTRKPFDRAVFASFDTSIDESKYVFLGFFLGDFSALKFFPSFHLCESTYVGNPILNIYIYTDVVKDGMGWRVPKYYSP